MSPPVFIVGNPRSGTTLMAVLLDRHSQLATSPESRFFVHLEAFEKAASRGYEDLLDAWWAFPESADFSVSREDLRQRLLELPCEARSLLVALLETYAKRMKKAQWVEKTPGHVFQLDRIFEWFPEAKVVVMLRDGRDVVESVRRLPGWSQSPWRIAAYWRRSVKAMRRGLRLWPDKVVMLRHDALLRQPEMELRRVMEFIGLDYEASQLDPGTPSQLVQAREMVWKGPALEALDPTRLEGWRRFDPGQLGLANARLWPQLMEESFPETEIRGSLWLRLQWWMKRTLWTVALLPSMEWVRKLVRRFNALRRKFA